MVGTRRKGCLLTESICIGWNWRGRCKRICVCVCVCVTTRQLTQKCFPRFSEEGKPEAVGPPVCLCLHRFRRKLAWLMACLEAILYLLLLFFFFFFFRMGVEFLETLLFQTLFPFSFNSIIKKEIN